MAFTLQQFNRIIRKLSIPLNIINILVGLVIGIAHVYLPFASLGGLILGCCMAVSGSLAMAVSYFFTTKNTGKVATETSSSYSTNTKKSTMFLTIAVPCLLLNAAASFFGAYTGILLLAAALASPLSPVILIVFAVTAASILAAGTLINSWLQAHDIWQAMRQSNFDKGTYATLQFRHVATQTENYQEEFSKIKTPSSKNQLNFTSLINNSEAADYQLVSSMSLSTSGCHYSKSPSRRPLRSLLRANG